MLFDLEHYEDFDVAGHIGYLDKYLPNIDSLKEKTPFEYRDFPDLLDAILKSVILRGKGIEVNTSNYSVYEWPTPIKSVLKRFYELGGEVVTVGSDAHVADKDVYKRQSLRRGNQCSERQSTACLLCLLWTSIYWRILML